MNCTSVPIVKCVIVEGKGDVVVESCKSFAL